MGVFKIILGTVYLSLLLFPEAYGNGLPIDGKATKETVYLYRNLAELSKNGQFLFGHQDALAYGVGWKSIPGKSDIKEVTGDHPALCGWDLAGIETGSLVNITGVSFAEIKQHTIEGYERGEIITYSWHMMNPLTGGSAWDAKKGTVSSILPGHEKHEIYKRWLDAVAGFMLSLKDKDGVLIPVILRPFHELNGNWFWWGRANCTADELKQLWQFTIRYLRDEKNVHNVLYAFNTDVFKSENEFLQRYPGNEWVDIVGFDIYQQKRHSNRYFARKLKKGLTLLNAVALQQNKIPALTEFGYNKLPDGKWWTQVFSETVKKHRLAYAMAWRNSGTTEYYAPYAGQPSAEDFRSFYHSGIALFSKEAGRRKMYQPADSSTVKVFETGVAMDDGIALSTRIFLPDTNKAFAAVLIRTPYNKELEMWMDKRFLSNNIAIIIQDVRGKYKSGGEFYPFANEREDGLTTLRWIRKQPWSNGIIGGWGVSYMGYTQWVIADSLDAAAPLFTSDDMYSFIYPDGVFSLQSAFLWGYANAAKNGEDMSAERVRQRLSRLPLSVAADSISFLLDWLKHEKRDEYWDKLQFHGPITSPVISVAGWYDIFLKGQLNSMQQLADKGNPQSKFIIGPWAHGLAGYKNDYGGEKRTGSYGQMSFEYMLNALKGKSMRLSPPLKESRFNLFIIEKNEYAGSDVWPPEETTSIPYYLQADHSLSAQPPIKSKIYSYTYDPSDPYPNYGGTFLGDSVGPALQNRNMSRTDQVNFETPALEEPLILLGPISASLWLSGNTDCSDIIVCLEDVFPDGKIINIQEGASKVFFKGKEAQKQNISVWATGYQLNPRHKLRVTICSSRFPRFNRSLNTCESIYEAKQVHKATPRIHVGPEMPSCIHLPVYTPDKLK
ncbi:MAG: CocE/NonD family hydrolase [Chitinophagaceae bacterium]|nr:CocE/NonD family hydrolase [Chitinophagaceae bacterium]MCW5929421.1 CocE/NonD family hydrolase [Chitinophagaceae bacterium]